MKKKKDCETTSLNLNTRLECVQALLMNFTLTSVSACQVTRPGRITKTKQSQGPQDFIQVAISPETV